MTRIILIALLALPAATAQAGDPAAPCCLEAEPPPARSSARVWFRDDSPARLAVVVSRGPGADTQGFVAAAGLTAAIGDGCGPVTLRPRMRLLPDA
jgi:hypothetical protein